MAKNDTPRLDWASKPKTVERVSLPFQVVETINESRATREAQRGSLFGALGDPPSSEWRNKLIWGDNKLTMGSLLTEYAGRFKLVYIDPPFGTGTDFSYQVKIGDVSLTKLPSLLEEHAYRDTWGLGRTSYLTMLYERLVLIYDLLAPDGSLYVHLDPTMSHYVKLILDEIFGASCFRSEIVWRRSNSHNKLTGQYGPIHDSLLYYTKSDTYTFHPGLRPFSRGYIEERFKYRDSRGIYQPNYLTGPGTRKGDSGRPWRDFDPTSKGRHWALPSTLVELLDINTTNLTTQQVLDQLAEADLLVIPKKAGGQPMYKQYLTGGVPYQDLWAYVPNSQGQLYESEDCIDQDVKWLEQETEKIGFQTQKPEGLLARILTTSSDPGDLVGDFFCGSGTTAVVAETLGRRWVACDLGRFAIHVTRKRLLGIENCQPFEVSNLGAYERQHWQKVTTGSEISTYLNFILSLYDAQPVEGFAELHGTKAGRFIHVGAVDAPVTIDEIERVMDELAGNGLQAADVLGWDWEMGLHDVVGEEARRRGLSVACRQIPREVMKADPGDEVRFFELAFLDLHVVRQERSVRVELRDFVIASEELIPPDVRSKISRWSDYIDYWSVDFNFRDDTFHNEWQAYRTRDEPKLAAESDWHDYDVPGRYSIVVKVIDIFGNDTTKLAEASIK